MSDELVGLFKFSCDVSSTSDQTLRESAGEDIEEDVVYEDVMKDEYESNDTRVAMIGIIV